MFKISLYKAEPTHFPRPYPGRVGRVSHVPSNSVLGKIGTVIPKNSLRCVKKRVQKVRFWLRPDQSKRKKTIFAAEFGAFGVII